MAPLSLKSWRPYKFVKIRSWSFKGPNLVLVCFGGVPGGGGGGALVDFGAAFDWNRICKTINIMIKDFMCFQRKASSNMVLLAAEFLPNGSILFADPFNISREIKCLL